MKPCVIFDLDGTLVESLPGIAASLNRSLTAHGLPAHSDAAVRSFIGDGLNQLVQRAAPANSDPALIDSLVAHFKKDYDLTWAEGTMAYPGIVTMLAALQRDGFPLAVLSNKTHDFTETITRTMFPQINFAQVLGQQEGIPHKPDPGGALQIATAMGTTAENCVVIGDSTMDLETADRAGMQSICVVWGYHDVERLLAAGAKHIADVPEDVRTILSGISD